VPHGLPPARPRPWPRNTPRRQEQPRLTRTRPTRSRPPRRRPARATDGVRTKPASIDFYETRTGQCRILPPLTHRVAEACNSWRKAIAPVSEHVAHLVADYTATTISRRTPLTQANLARARERIAAASEERAGCSTTEPEVRKEMSNAAARARCGKCGSVNIHLNDDLCSWCATSRNTRVNGR
jgi:hypothetical protein